MALSRFSETEKDEIARRLNSGEMIKDLATEFGISISYAHSLKHRNDEPRTNFEPPSDERFIEKWSDRPRRPAVMPHVVPGITMKRLMAGR